MAAPREESLFPGLPDAMPGSVSPLRLGLRPQSLHPGTQNTAWCLGLPGCDVPPPCSARAGGAHSRQDAAPPVPATVQGAASVNSRGADLSEHPVDTALGLLHIPIPPS